MDQSSRIKTILASTAIGLFILIVFGLIWFFFLGPTAPVGLGWYLFSFAAGLSMIVLPCTLPLAFVIVPLSMGKGAGKGLGMAVAFGLGVAVTLSMYGIAAAVVGEVAIGTLGAPLEVVKNWLYFIAGIFAFAFALGEIGLISFHLPTYTGAAPAFIQKQGDYLKALLLGLFLGNIGVGCPHPATPVILTRIAASGDVFYGWLLFFVHAVGRVLPLLLLALLAILGINALSWLISRKDKVERATGWGMIFVAAFILVLGLFSHDWWVYSGQHTLLEELTGEERFLGVIVQRFNLAEPPHTHGIPAGTGLFGLPLALGSWVLVGLWVLPLWWYYLAKRKALSAKRRAADQGSDGEVKVEEQKMPYRFWLFLTLSLLLAITFIGYLPTRFQHQALTAEEEAHGEEVMMEAGEGHGGVLYHEEGEISEGLAVNLNLTPVPVVTASTTRLDFFVNQKPGNVPVPAQELEFDHEKLMHVIGVRRDMNEFFHIHPEPAQIFSENLGGQEGMLSAGYTFQNSGLYKIWSEIKKDGVNHAFGHPEFTVEGSGAPESKQVSFGRSAVIGNYQVSLKMDEPVVKVHEHKLVFDIHTAGGEEVEVEDYLGAKMHLSVIKDDWKQFIHTHPVRDGSEEHGSLRGSTFSNLFLRSLYDGLGISNGTRPAGAGGEEHAGFLVEEARANGRDDHETAAVDGDEVVRFAVSFPEAGLYKAFAQFRPKGANLSPDEAYITTFWIKVEEKAPLALPAKWINFIGSAILIIFLSRAVKRYITVAKQ